MGVTLSAFWRRVTPRGVMATLRMPNQADSAARTTIARAAPSSSRTPTHISEAPIGQPWKAMSPHAGSVTA